MEVEPFNLEEFISNNNDLIDEYYLKGPFTAWIIAEEAYKDGKFGVANPKLVLQLVSRGGFSNSERTGDIDFAYDNWKNSNGNEFSLCG